MRQLDLGLEAPGRHRSGSARSFHAQLETPAEAAQGERRASRQDAMVLDVFQRYAVNGRRLTPSQVHAYLCFLHDEHAPLLTSVRRALTNLTARGDLVHHSRDRRPGPRGARESSWGLA